MSEEFKRKTKMDISDDKRALAKLKHAAEQTKRILSQKDIAPCFVESLYEGADLNSVVNRGRFEGMSEPLIKKCERLIIETLAIAAIPATSVTMIHLIGGSSRIPKYQQLIKSIFADESKIVNYTEPDEMISRGCAAIAMDIIDIGMEDYKLARETVKAYTSVPVFTKDVGYIINNELVVVVPRNTPVPCRRKVVIERKKTQATFTLTVGQSNKDDVKSVGTLLLEDLASDVDSVLTVVFTYEKSQLIVSASDKASSVNGEVKISIHA